MDEKTIAALNALADKLGTTGEYLWNVLISQAIISSIVDLVVLVGLYLLAWMWYLVVKKNTTVPSDSGMYPRANWNDDFTSLAWVSVFIGVAIVVLITFSHADIIISGFINPEYWALNRITNL